MSMVLDTRIAMSGQPLDVAGSLAKGYQLRQLGQQAQMGELEMQQARANMERQTRLRDLMGGLGAEATDDQRIGALRAGGYFEEADKLQKGLLDRRKIEADAANTQSQIAERDFALKKKRIDAARQVIASLSTLPAPTTQDAIGVIRQNVALGMMTPDEGAEMARGLPPDDQLVPFLRRMGMQIAQADKVLEMQLPKVDLRDTGSAIVPVRTNQLTGEVMPGQPVAQKTMTPGERAADARARERLALDRETAGTQFVPVEGVGLFVGDKRTGQARPVTGPGGEPIKASKALTEGQAKANLFASRMAASDKIINDLAAQGVNTPSLGQQVTNPSGVSGRIATAVAKPEQQKIDQAQRDFINAVLRRESGAVISDQEFINARLQYFPQPGDSPDVMEQKRANRALAIEGMMAEVPEERRTVKPQSATAQPAPAMPKIGLVQDGYIYQGGDPSNPASWKKATK